MNAFEPSKEKEIITKLIEDFSNIVYPEENSTKIEKIQKTLTELNKKIKTIFNKNFRLGTEYSKQKTEIGN